LSDGALARRYIPPFVVWVRVRRQLAGDSRVHRRPDERVTAAGAAVTRDAVADREDT
jgi:hypothetical protein